PRHAARRARFSCTQDAASSVLPWLRCRRLLCPSPPAPPRTPALGPEAAAAPAPGVARRRERRPAERRDMLRPLRGPGAGGEGRACARILRVSLGYEQREGDESD